MRKGALINLNRPSPAVIRLSVGLAAAVVIGIGAAVAQQAIERASDHCSSAAPGDVARQNACMETQLDSLRAFGALMENHPAGTPAGDQLVDCYRTHHNDFSAAIDCAADHLELNRRKTMPVAAQEREPVLPAAPRAPERPSVPDLPPIRVLPTAERAGE